MKQKIHDKINLSVNDLIYIVSTIVFCSYIIWGILDRNNHLKGEKKIMYSVGEIYDIQFKTRHSPWFRYNFTSIDGKQKTGDYTIPNNIFKRYSNDSLLKLYVGKKYLIRFSADKPLYNELQWDEKEVSDSIIMCCRYHIWDNIPR